MIVPVRATPEQAQQKWAQNLQSSTALMAERVAAVTEAPGAKAARASQLWLQKVSQAKDKFARNVGRVSLQDWQASMTQIGIPRVAQGAQQKAPKVGAFMSEFLPYLAQGVAQVERMPKGSVEDGIARAAMMIRHNAGFKRGGGS